MTLPNIFDADFGNSTALGRKQRAETTIEECELNAQVTPSEALSFAVAETLDLINEKHICSNCGESNDTVEFGPDPYAQKIEGDDTHIWLCKDCLYESSMAI
jgi:hypothetical protein